MFSLRASNYWAISWLISLDPSGCARRNNLDRDIYRLDGTLVTHQVYVPAAYVGEALACLINVRSARRVVGVVDSELSRYNRDEAGTRMRVPPSVRPKWECVLGDINVGISPDVHLEVPREPRAWELPAHQVERARRKVARRRRKIHADNPAHVRCEGRRADDERQCDDKWQNWYFLKLSQ